MRYLGVALHISRSGLLTVKSTEPPRIGSKVVIKGRGPIGNVIDVFGPVGRPYVSVKLWRDFPGKHVSDVEIFVEDRDARQFRKSRRYNPKRSF